MIFLLFRQFVSVVFYLLTGLIVTHKQLVYLFGVINFGGHLSALYIFCNIITSPISDNRVCLIYFQVINILVGRISDDLYFFANSCFTIHYYFWNDYCSLSPHDLGKALIIILAKFIVSQYVIAYLPVLP